MAPEEPQQSSPGQRPGWSDPEKVGPREGRTPWWSDQACEACKAVTRSWFALAGNVVKDLWHGSGLIGRGGVAGAEFNTNRGYSRRQSPGFSLTANRCFREVPGLRICGAQPRRPKTYWPREIVPARRWLGLECGARSGQKNSTDSACERCLSETNLLTVACSQTARVEPSPQP